MFTFYLHLLFTLSAFFSFQNNTVNIDVLDYQIHIKEIDFEAQTLKAQTRIRFKMTDLNTAQAEFSLIGFTIDSCYFNGEDIDFTHENNKIIFNLPENRKSGDIYRFYVFYQGKPAKDKYWGGFFIEDEMAYNYGVGMEAVPPVYGRAWFPCHDVFTDRALYTIIIDAPKGFG
ncbi:MAG: hypothetical protein KAI79_07510, partial [Bacteroidales bacterium]|nr:hypothetical protein [Bacteroidales bacterium]